MKIMTKIKTLIAISLSAIAFFCAGIFFQTYSVAKAEEIKTTSDMFCSGAEIRIASDNTSGIRFIVRVKKDGALGNINEYTSGMLVIPSDKLVGELTVATASNEYFETNGARAANVNCTGQWNEIVDKDGKTYLQSAVYIYNIKEESDRNRAFAFRGYYVDENNNYLYTENNDYSVRSLTYVALKAKQDGMEEDFVNGILPTQRISVESKLRNISSYLYRVGNQNEVSLSSLISKSSFEEDDIALDLEISCESNHGVTANITKNTTDGLKDTIKFNGTGVVTLTIQDKYSKKSVTLNLEVVDAKNITQAENAEKNNVVLLNDISGTFTVSNGYTFYGNGFTVTCSGDGSYRSAALSYGFITVENGGILDNVQVICDIFPESYLYTSEMKTNTEGRYPYGYSAIVISGNSTISNSYIYGARNNIFVTNGNITIENTVTECGSLANIQIKSSDANTVTLKDVTTIQYKTTSKKYDTSKTVLGFGVLVGESESASNPTLKLEGTLTQYNWVTSEDISVSNTYASKAIENALKNDYETIYQHIDSNNKSTVNIAIVYLNNKTANIEDHRTNISTISYELNSITMSGQTGQVYSIYNGGNTTKETPYDNADVVEYIYTANTNRDILPTISFNGKHEAITFESGYNTTEGKKFNELTFDLDNIDGGSYDFYFNDISVLKYGKNLGFTVKDSDGNTVDKDTAITLNQLITLEYTFVVTDNLLYKADGTVSESKTVELPFTIKATKTSIDPPKFTNAGTATAIRLASSAGGDWRPAYTVLTGVSVTYWSASESKVKTVDLSTLYNSGTISSNVWTYTCNDYTLTITGGAVHSDGTTITPVVANNTLYFASTNKAFGTGTTSRSIILTYVFTDKNDSTTWNRTETVTYSELSEYDYNSFKNDGTLKEPGSSSGGTCLAEGTLITLADGTQVRVDSLTGNEQLLVWNLETGKLDSAPIMFVDSEKESIYEIIHLYFSDGTDVKVISEHGFWDYDLNKYVYLDNQASQYIGHTFAKQNGDTLEKVQLTNVVIETETTTAWSPVTVGHLCYFVNGMLSMPGGVGGLFNIFEVDAETMTYDNEAMQKDIETYGLFTYEELNSYVALSEDMFNAAGGAYLKISIGKGNMTMDELIAMITRYSVYFK